MQKLLTKSFRKILHAIGTEEMKNIEDGNSRARLRSLKVMSHIYHMYEVKRYSNYCRLQNTSNQNSSQIS